MKHLKIWENFKPNNEEDKDNYYRIYGYPSGGYVLYHVWAFEKGDDGMTEIDTYDDFDVAEKTALDMGLENMPMFIKNQMDN